MNRLILTTALMVFLALIFAIGTPSLAAKEGHGDQPAHATHDEAAAHDAHAGDSGHGEHDEHDGGHEVSSPFAGTRINSITTVVIFLLLLIVLGKFAWGPVLTALQKREDFIQNSLDQAKQDRADAEAKLQELTDRLNKAREEASAIVDEGRRDAEVVRRTVESEARTEADAMIERAKREIGIARDAAVKDLYETAADMATEVAAKVVRKEISAAEHDRLIQESINDLRKLHEEGSGFSSN